MRFNTKEEVREAAVKAAQDDYRRHIEYGVSLNVYSTPGARNYWQRGFDNAPAYSWEHDLDWDFQYQRGKAAAEIVNANKEKDCGKSQSI